MITTVTQEEKMQNGSTGKTVEPLTGQMVKAEERETINKNTKGQKMEKETATKRNLVKLSGNTDPKTEKVSAPEAKDVKVELMTKEEQELYELEQKIRASFMSILFIGKIMREITEKELYKVKGYRTIADYGDKEWGYTYRRLKQLTDAYILSENVNKISSSPVKMTNEGQARQLGRIPENKQAEVWDEIVKGLPEGEMPTAKVIKAVVDNKLGTTPKKKAEAKAPEAAAKEAGIGTEPAKYFMFHVGSFMEMITWDTDNKDEKLARIIEDNDKAVQSLVTE